MGHREFKTTEIYADYMPGAHEADLVDLAFERPGPNPKGIREGEIHAELKDGDRP